MNVRDIIDAIVLGGFKRAVVEQIARLKAQGEQTRMAVADLKAALDAISAAADNIAADVTNLKNQIAVGMTPAQVAEVQAQADGLVSRLKGIADETPDVPVTPPGPTE